MISRRRIAATIWRMPISTAHAAMTISSVSAVSPGQRNVTTPTAMPSSPMRIDAQRGDVVHTLGDARQIAHPVAVAVLKAARIYLVNRRSAPPGRGIGRSLFLHRRLRICLA